MIYTTLEILVYLKHIKNSLSLAKIIKKSLLENRTGVDAGYFRHRYTDFGHSKLGMPKFNFK